MWIEQTHFPPVHLVSHFKGSTCSLLYADDGAMVLLVQLFGVFLFILVIIERVKIDGRLSKQGTADKTGEKDNNEFHGVGHLSCSNAVIDRKFYHHPGFKRTLGC
jgi:hypothetical protein